MSSIYLAGEATRSLVGLPGRHTHPFALRYAGLDGVFSWVSSVALDLENDAVFSAALEGLPRVVEFIATVPQAKRSLALAAAQQSYLKTAQTLGYDEADARQWALAVMSLLEIASVASNRAAEERWPIPA